jgi:hypothetical protein
MPSHNAYIIIGARITSDQITNAAALRDCQRRNGSPYATVCTKIASDQIKVHRLTQLPKTDKLPHAIEERMIAPRNHQIQIALRNCMMQDTKIASDQIKVHHLTRLLKTDESPHAIEERMTAPRNH